VRRSLPDNHTYGSHVTKAFDRSGNKKRVGIDMVPRGVINKIGFQQNGLAPNFQVKEIQARLKNFCEVLSIGLSAEDCDSGTRPLTNNVVTGFG
jgi:hypothetical protein